MEADLGSLVRLVKKAVDGVSSVESSLIIVRSELENLREELRDIKCGGRCFGNCNKVCGVGKRCKEDGGKSEVWSEEKMGEEERANVVKYSEGEKEEELKCSGEGKVLQDNDDWLNQDMKQSSTLGGRHDWQYASSTDEKPMDFILKKKELSNQVGTADLECGHGTEDYAIGCGMSSRYKMKRKDEIKQEPPDEPKSKARRTVEGKEDGKYGDCYGQSKLFPTSESSDDCVEIPSDVAKNHLERARLTRNFATKRTEHGGKAANVINVFFELVHLNYCNFIKRRSYDGSLLICKFTLVDETK